MLARSQARSLKDVVRREYGLTVSSFDVLAAGEEVTALVAIAGDRRVVVKVHDSSDPYRELVFRLAASIALEARMEAAVCPLSNVRGEPFAKLDNRLITVERLVDGGRPARRELLTAKGGHLGSLVGHVHACRPSWPGPDQLSDNLQTSCVVELEHLIDEAASSSRAAEPHRRKAAAALLAAGASLTAAGTTLAVLRAQVAEHPINFVPTHGDLTERNVLVDTTGRLSLIDWTSALWAPAERDLVFFAGEGLGAFLHGYSQVRPLDDVRAELFEFYVRRWRLDGVVFFGRRALAGEHPRSRDAYPLLARFIAAAAEPADSETEFVRQFLEARAH